MNQVVHRPRFSSLANQHLKRIFYLYLFFFYFSGITHVLVQVTDGTIFIGLRQAIYMSLIWLVPVLLFPSKTKAITAAIGLILWLTSLLSLGYFCIYHQEFSQSVLYIIFESNLKESSEFIDQYFKWWMPLVLIAHSIMSYALWKTLKPVDLSLSPRIITSLLIISFVFLVPIFKDKVITGLPWPTALEQMQARMEPAEPWPIIMAYLQYRNQLGNMQNLLAKNHTLPPLDNLQDKHVNQPGTLVLVIGESSNRQHWGLYGYPRDTTPNLNSMRDELNVFTQVLSPRASTIEALEQILTFADRDNPNAVMTQPSLMNLMKQAGYKTFWITNQQTITKRNTMLAYFSQLADVQRYTNFARYQNSREYDSNVFEPFEEALTDPAPRKFIVVHLLGTHMKYQYRYPASYDHFKDRQGLPAQLDDEQANVVNSYDNAVRFNDYVIFTLLQTLKRSNQRSMLTFLSDHGEDVYDSPPYQFLGRNEGKPTLPMFAIPMFVWMSEAWKQSEGLHLDAMLDREYSTAYFEHTWSDLAGLQYDGHDPTKSIVNTQFAPRPTWIGDPSFRNGMKIMSQSQNQLNAYAIND